MKFQIKNRWTGNVQFECELDAKYESESRSIQLGVAVRLAYESNANLSDANLFGADLRGADLRGAYLSGAYLRGAYLRGANLFDANLSDANLFDANLSDANLFDANLSDANLRDADLRGANLRDAYLSGADLRGAYLSGADLSGVPKIKNIHQAVYKAASKEGALDMGTWHKCETTHCRAGWVTTLAGEGGAAMEFCMGTAAAASLIYLASDPELERIPDFYASNEAALADMKRLAEKEAGTTP